MIINFTLLKAPHGAFNMGYFGIVYEYAITRNTREIPQILRIERP